MNIVVLIILYFNFGMQVIIFENLMGIDGFEFVEFVVLVGRGQELYEYFWKMGFSVVFKYKQCLIIVYCQGDVNFLVNEDFDLFVVDFVEKYGLCVCGFVICFKKLGQEVYQIVLGNGVEVIVFKLDSKVVSVLVIKGIGDCMLYLVDCYGSVGSIYDGDYELIVGVDLYLVGFGLIFIDYLIYNLYFGNMQQWLDYYECLFNFCEICYFDIKGLKIGLVFKVMIVLDGIVCILLNELFDLKSQINEYLDVYKGEGIQYIVCFIENIYEIVEVMCVQGVDFFDILEIYFDVIDQCVLNYGEDVLCLVRNKILIDVDLEIYQCKLLQIFIQNCIGLIFFEIIQCKGNEGFGEGNFIVLFESIECDQICRGVL